MDSDGISIGANKVTLNGGTIADSSGNSAVLTHEAVAADSGHMVNAPDATAPTISSVEITSDPGDDDAYGIDGEIEITVTFSEEVTVTDSPQLELDLGGSAKTADYAAPTRPRWSSPTRWPRVTPIRTASPSQKTVSA